MTVTMVAAMVAAMMPVEARSGEDSDADGRSRLVIGVAAIRHGNCDTACQSKDGDCGYDQAFHARSSGVDLL